MYKTVGEVVGSMAAMLLTKGVFTLDEFKTVVGEDIYKDIIKNKKFQSIFGEAADNDDK